MTNKKWFVIERTSYGTSGDSFVISKVADTVEQATTFKVHLDALNESKNKFYFVKPYLRFGICFFRRGSLCVL